MFEALERLSVSLIRLTLGFAILTALVLLALHAAESPAYATAYYWIVDTASVLDAVYALIALVAVFLVVSLLKRGFASSYRTSQQ